MIKSTNLCGFKTYRYKQNPKEKELHNKFIEQFADNDKHWYIHKARKDNEVVKRGDPYIRVKRSKFAPVEMFRDEVELERNYPIHYDITKSDIISLLKNYREELKTNPHLQPKKFLKLIKFKEEI